MRLANDRQAGRDPDDVPIARQGLITTTADAARSLRDGDDTPSEGTEAEALADRAADIIERNRPGGKPPKKRRRPGWAGVIAAMLAAGPGWTEVRGVIDEVTGKDDAVAAAAELGELKGRLDEQSRALRDLHGKVAANEAGDLEAASNGALEFRHLDKQILQLGKNIDQLMVAAQIPEAARTALLETPIEIVERHDAEIREYRDARAKAEREALERSLAAGDTVGP